MDRHARHTTPPPPPPPPGANFAQGWPLAQVRRPVDHAGSHHPHGAGVRQGFSASLSRIRVWKRLRVLDSQNWEHVDAKRRCTHQHADSAQRAHDRTGVG